jgi:hypothetical protein
MARTIRDAKLETRAARARLLPRRKPHWKTLVPGTLHLGYRRKDKDRPGIWLVRRYVGTERYRIVQLGIANDFEDSALSYEDAQRRAYEHRFKSEAYEPRFELTVTEAVARYVEWMKLHRLLARRLSGGRLCIFCRS